MSPAVGSRSRLPAGTGFALAGAGLVLALAAALAAIRATHGSGGENHVEGMLPTLAMAAALAAPGVVAVIGVLIRRPVLFGAAGLACVPLIVVSIAAFPILIPAGLLLAAFGKAMSEQHSLSPLAVVVLVGFPLPIITGLWILITRTAQYTYTYPGGSEGGEYFTPAHARLCIALVVADIAIAALLARLSAAPLRTVRAPTSRSACGS